MLKKGSLKKIKPSLTILLSSFVFIFSSPTQTTKLLLQWYFSVMGFYLFLPDYLFCLSYHKTQWTMLLDSVGPKMYLLGPSNSMVTLIIFPSRKPKWAPRQIQQPIINFARPRDDFMVHGVNNPLGAMI